MTDWIDKFFDMEQIDGDGLCPTYMYRWTLLRLFGWKVSLHHFVGNDWALDPHDHPKDFYSIGLWGEYTERYRNQTGGYSTKVWVAPWCRFFPATHVHRIMSKSCWTLVIVSRQKRNWGFYLHDHQWWRWDQYIKKYGEARRDC